MHNNSIIIMTLCEVFGNDNYFINLNIKLN
jgi:hypothetical protein